MSAFFTEPLYFAAVSKGLSSAPEALQNSEGIQQSERGTASHDIMTVATPLMGSTLKGYIAFTIWTLLLRKE